MVYLFVHQTFPGQYAHIVRHLASQSGNSVYFITTHSDVEIPGVRKITYRKAASPPASCHCLTVDLDAAIRTGAIVAEICSKLRDEHVIPDLVIGHCGWGETLFVKDIFPDAPVLTYFEFYYHATGVDLDFDPEFASQFQGTANLRTRNGIALMAFDASDWGQSPTRWQRSLLPPELRERVTVLHEGVDTDRLHPDPDAMFSIPERQLTLTREDEVITFVARNLEPYRGFHIFMRAVPEIQRRRPNAHVIIAGADGVHYGQPAHPRHTYRELMLTELGDRIDPDRIHFLNHIEYDRYRRLLQVSSVHVYLTYPFILSWSFIEAMASGCLIVASDTPPVLEVLEDRYNGLTVDFFSTQQIAERIDEVLTHPDRMQQLRDAARRTAVERYDLNRLILPKWKELLENLSNGEQPSLDP